MDEENFADMIKSLVGDDKDIQKYLVDELVNYYEMDAATKWAKIFEIPKEELPEQVLERLETDQSTDR